MAVFFRAITYAVLFIGFMLISVPARLLSWFGIVYPATIDIQQAIGMVIGTTSAVIALWCIFTFVFVGRGTLAPFDPPRRLVIQGPYRFVRNPMYVGAGLALAGAALFYEAWPLLGYTAIFFLAAHLFVVFYEEPALRQTFGQEYEAYRDRVGRWLPHMGF